MRPILRVLVFGLALGLAPVARATAGDATAGAASEEAPVATPGSADEAPKPHADDAHVEVRGALPDEADAAAFATHLDASEARARGADLADLLRRVPGARVRDYGGIGAYATLSLRASTSEQVVVLVDGVPQNRALGGPVDLSSIPATQLGEVTVYRGFAPAAYGLGGIGGLVDVRTVAPDGLTARADLLAGQLATARIAADGSFATGAAGRLRIGIEGLASDGAFDYLDTGGTPFDPADDRLRERENNDVDSGSLLVQHQRDDTGGGSLRLGLRLADRERGVPGVDGFPSTTARLEESLAELSGAWKRTGDDALRSVALLFDATAQEIAFTDLAGDIGLAAQDRTTRLAGGGVAGIGNWTLGRHRLTLRGDLRREQARLRDAALEVADRGGARRNLFALTAEDAIGFGRFHIAPSLRWEARNDDFDGSPDGTVPPAAADVREDDLAGKIGVAWAMSETSSLRASAGRFFRSPSLLELFGDRGSVAGNPRLRSESGESIEAGIVRERPAAWRWEAVGFARWADDLIRFLPASQGTAVARNVASAEVRGVETSAAVRRPRGWSFEGSLTWQEAADTSGGFSDGEPLPYQPEWLGYLGIAWEHDGYDARWDLTYTGENTTTAIDLPEFRMPERFVHDLFFGREWRSGWRAGLDVRNVFDVRTRDVARFPLPDRTVLVSLGWRWDAAALAGGDTHGGAR